MNIKTIAQLCADWRSGTIKLQELKNAISEMLLKSSFDKHPALFKKWVGQQQKNKNSTVYIGKEDEYKEVDDHLSNFFVLPVAETDTEKPTVEAGALSLEFDD